MRLLLGRKNDVDIRIRHLSNKELVRGLNKKQLSADELKQLGDLFLEKGETGRAIDYLYRAAEELSVTHLNKALAVYKKILKIRPEEIKACERIVSVLSAEGLAAEQVKYLMIIAQFHESKNDVRETTSVYRRILDIDPGNQAAVRFFNRGKVGGWGEL
jgi:tetratricopeptide (TPR) repeat protein